MKLFRKFVRDAAGATAIEYGLIAGRDCYRRGHPRHKSERYLHHCRKRSQVTEACIPMGGRA
jgi:hypothetical protein